MTFGLLLKKAIGIPGLYIFSSVVIIISLMLLINAPVSQYIEGLRAKRKEAMKNRESEMETEDAVTESSVYVPGSAEKAAAGVKMKTETLPASSQTLLPPHPAP